MYLYLIGVHSIVVCISVTTLSPSWSVFHQSSLSAADSVSLLPHFSQTALGVSSQPQFPCLHSQETCAALLASAKQGLCLLRDLVSCTLKATDALCHLSSWVTGTAVIFSMYLCTYSIGTATNTQNA